MKALFYFFLAVNSFGSDKPVEYTVSYVPFSFSYPYALTEDNFAKKVQCSEKIQVDLKDIFFGKMPSSKKKDRDYRFKIAVIHQGKERVIYLDKEFNIFRDDRVFAPTSDQRLRLTHLQEKLDKCATEKWYDMTCKNRTGQIKMIIEKCKMLKDGKWPEPMKMH